MKIEGESSVADAVLLRRIAKGDEDAFSALVHRYQDRFYTVARRILGDDRESEDAVQRAFLQVFLKASHYRDRWRGSTWLYRILTNICVDAWRKRRHEARALRALENPAAAPRMVERHDLDRALAQLPVEARAILLLRYVEDLSYAEIARVRGITVNTVKSQLRRGKWLLRRSLKGGKT